MHAPKVKIAVHQQKEEANLLGEEADTLGQRDEAE
jgi:hypothetical protein